ncbi:germin-like protein 7 [Actinidia rufa]|uniref:Germin-like protein n=1 Tax=Actinidia rufa TaxID=165716 RepID=A0A7J0EPY8_9ERIC|nr:germin-like protein 7 [Actinidia rufa]
MKTTSFSLQFFLSLALVLGGVKPDPDPLQDYCISDTTIPKFFFINGEPCLNPSLAKSSQFVTSALSNKGNTNNPFGFNVTLTNTDNLPGANTQGLTMARIDLAPFGVVPPHSHPRASELTTCLQGTIFVGFVTTSNRLFTQQLRPGDSFVFPKALVHFSVQC